MTAPNRAAAGSSSRRRAVEICYASAHEALAQDDDTGATRLFGVLATLAPTDVRPWLGLALCAERADDSVRGGALFRIATAVDPESAPAWHGLARCLERQRRVREAAVAAIRADALTDAPLETTP